MPGWADSFSDAHWRCRFPSPARVSPADRETYNGGIDELRGYRNGHDCSAVAGPPERRAKILLADGLSSRCGRIPRICTELLPSRNRPALSEAEPDASVVGHHARKPVHDLDGDLRRPDA